MSPFLCTATGFALLHRRAFYRAIRTEDTTVTAQRLENGMTVLAFVKPLAGIGGHGFGLAMPALRAGEGGVQNDMLHGRLPVM